MHAQTPDPEVPGPPRVLAAPDAFKGTATASEIADAIAAGASQAGWEAELCPLSDGGEGFLDVFGVLGGEVRTSRVTGPLGEPVVAEWRIAGDLAVVESARASGLVAAGGTEHNDPMGATSRGTGELIVAAVCAGAKRVIVGVGGSAMTDGGLGAVEAIDEAGGIREAEVLVACDVTVRFEDAARIFGPQKGASPVQVEQLGRRLAGLVAAYGARGVDVSEVPGAGAAGGLAGGLLVVGAHIESGFQLVAELVGLGARMSSADLTITGEGSFDATSAEGKVVAGVAGLAADSGARVFVIAGRVDSAALEDVSRYPAVHGVLDLSEIFGPDIALADPVGCVALATQTVLAGVLR